VNVDVFVKKSYINVLCFCQEKSDIYVVYITNEIYETAETEEKTEKEIIWKCFGEKFFPFPQTRRQVSAYDCKITSVPLVTVVLDVARHESVCDQERIGL